MKNVYLVSEADYPTMLVVAPTMAEAIAIWCEYTESSQEEGPETVTQTGDSVLYRKRNGEIGERKI